MPNLELLCNRTLTSDTLISAELQVTTDCMLALLTSTNAFSYRSH